MEGVDLSKFDVESGADQGARLELLDKKGNKSGEWIHLLGADSKEYQRKLADQNQRRLSRLQRQQRLNQSDVDNDVLDRLVAATKDWSLAANNGEKLPVTPQNVENVYRASKLIYEQVDAFVHERGNFTQA
jgi:hypothetical protein